MISVAAVAISPDLDVIEVDNPGYQMGNPDSIRRIQAVRTTRNDPLGKLHRQGHIDEPEYLAGRLWQKIYEEAGVGHVGSVDTTNEPVDCRPMKEVLTEKQHRAIKRLAVLDRALGKRDAVIIRDFLGDGCTAAQASLRHGLIPTRTEIEFFGRLFRFALTALAREFGLVSPMRRAN